MSKQLQGAEWLDMDAALGNGRARFALGQCGSLDSLSAQSRGWQADTAPGSGPAGLALITSPAPNILPHFLQNLHSVPRPRIPPIVSNVGDFFNENLLKNPFWEGSKYLECFSLESFENRTVSKS